MKHLRTMLLLLAMSACSHLATVSPASVDLSGTWVLDARRSDSPPPLGHRRSEAEENEDRETSYAGAGQAPPHFGGPAPLLPMLTATQMTIGQDAQSMGVEYPNQPYRDIKWGEQKRSLFKIDSGWENQRLIIETKSEPMTVREVYSLNEASDTLTLEIDLHSKRMGDRHVTRVFTRKTPAAAESAR